MICHKSKVIYIHPCRCAGTSIEIAFGFSPQELNESGERHALPDFYPKKFWKEYSSFVSVRNPWDRLLSGFALIKQHNISAYEPYLKEYSLKNFNQFVLDIMTKPELYKDDRMFWPQTKWFYYKKKRVPFKKVIRFESLSDDIGSLLKNINLKVDDLPHELKTNKPNYQDIYDQTSKEIVSQIYRKDIEVLGYEF